MGIHRTVVDANGTIIPRRIDENTSLGAYAFTTQILVSGAFTLSGKTQIVASESGTADELTTINGGVEGLSIILRADAGDTITIAETGNISLASGSTFAMSGDMLIRLVWTVDTWYELGRRSV